MSNFDDIFESMQQEPFNKEAWAAKKKAERDEVYGLVDFTAERICKDGEALRNYLDVQSHFYSYSATNALLLYAQQPSARKLGDTNYWRDQGVYVKKQEYSRPIKIVESNGEYAREDGSIGVSYNIKHVYDISQTTARAKAQQPILHNERDLLNALLYKRFVPVLSVDKLPKQAAEAGALYDYKQNVVLVRRGMDAPELFRELSRALAHAQIANSNQDNSYKDVDFKARCVSYILGKEFGVDVSMCDFSDIPKALRESEPQTIRTELSEIRDVAASISGKMIRSLEQSKADRPKERQER